MTAADLARAAAYLAAFVVLFALGLTGEVPGL